MPVKRASVGFLIALLLLTAAAADAGWQHTQAAGATARAYAIRVVVPGQTGAETPTVSAPNDQVQFSGSFPYGTGPDGNPIVSTGSAIASASVQSNRSNVHGLGACRHLAGSCLSLVRRSSSCRRHNQIIREIAVGEIHRRPERDTKTVDCPSRRDDRTEDIRVLTVYSADHGRPGGERKGPR